MGVNADSPPYSIPPSLPGSGKDSFWIPSSGWGVAGHFPASQSPGGGNKKIPQREFGRDLTEERQGQAPLGEGTRADLPHIPGLSTAQEKMNEIHRRGRLSPQMACPGQPGQLPVSVKVKWAWKEARALAQPWELSKAIIRGRGMCYSVWRTEGGMGYTGTREAVSPRREAFSFWSHPARV